MNDLISVIIPIYNVEHYLPRCIDSVLAQTYRNLEIFLVDDGSPDRCGEICDAYAEKDDRIKVIHKKNGGLSDARNAALDVCTGEYIGFVDSDDYVSEDFIASLYDTMQKFNTKLSVCGIIKFDDTGKMTADYTPSEVEKCVSGSEMFDSFVRPAAWNKLYHKTLFEGIRYPYGKLYEDLFIYHDILARTDRIAYTGKNSYYYFDRQNSIMNKKYDIRNTDLLEGLDLRIRKLRDMQYDEIADRQLVFLFDYTIEAFVRLNRTNDDAEKERLNYIKTIYNRHYKEMMRYNGFTPAQKAKITWFRYLPRFYLEVFQRGL